MFTESQTETSENLAKKVEGEETKKKIEESGTIKRRSLKAKKQKTESEIIPFSEVEDVLSSESDSEPVDEIEKEPEIDPVVTNAFKGADTAVGDLFKTTRETLLPMVHFQEMMAAESADDEDED